MRYSKEVRELISGEMSDILNRCIFEKDDGAKWSIFDYLGHNEIEMSMEGMWIETIAGNIKIPEDDIQRLLEFSKIMELDKESVFDDNIWQKIEVFAKSR